MKASAHQESKAILLEAPDRFALLIHKLGILAMEEDVPALATGMKDEHSQSSGIENMRDTYSRALFNSSFDPILVADHSGRYLDCNDAATKLLGYSVEELTRMNVSDLVAAGPAATEAAYEAFMEQGIWRGEVELRHKNGQIIPVEAAATGITLPWGRFGISTLRDISERRRLEGLRDDFLAMVGHELRNPLTPIIGYAHMLMRAEKFEPEFVQEILDQSERLQRVISDLLDSASVQAGRFSLDPTKFDLLEVLKRVVETSQRLSDRHQIQLECGSEPLFGVWDRDRLQQVFHNLISNAVKYSPAGGEINVVVSLKPDRIQITFSDTGIGLTPEQEAALFQPFVRTNTAKATGAPGLGLGLYISKLLVEAHGGSVAVHGRGANLGTEFRVQLPY